MKQQESSGGQRSSAFAEPHRAPGEIVRWVRYRSNGSEPVTVGFSLVVENEHGGTTTLSKPTVTELRAIARSLDLQPVVTWSNSSVVVSHAQTQGATAMGKATETFKGIVLNAADGEAIDLGTAAGHVRLLEVAKAECAAVKAAKREGATEMPSTPVLDYMNSSEYRAKREEEKSGKRGGTSKGGKAVRFDEDTLRTKCVELLAAGFTTKASMLKELRNRGEGARQQRFYPIADAVIAEATAKGTMPVKAATPSKKASSSKKAAPAKAAAKKAPAAKKSAVATKPEAVAKSAARKSSEARTAAKKSTATKTPAKKAAATKKVTPNFKGNPTPLLAELMAPIVGKRSSKKSA